MASPQQNGRRASKPPNLRNTSPSNIDATVSKSAAATTQKSRRNPTTRNDGGLVTLRYEDSAPAKPPIPVTVAPPRQPPEEAHPALRGSKIAGFENRKRDSGLAPTTSSSKGRPGSVNTVGDNVLGSATNSSSLPSSLPLSPIAIENMKKGQEQPPGALNIKTSNSTDSARTTSRWRSSVSRKESLPPQKSDSQVEMSVDEDFSPIMTPIPTEGFLDDAFMEEMQFSNRGSIMVTGNEGVNGQARENIGRRQPSFSMLASPSMKILPDDIDMESQKVRSMYEPGSNFSWDNQCPSNKVTIGEVLAKDEPEIIDQPLAPKIEVAIDRPQSATSCRSANRNQHELAGGIEDWEDVDGSDVDRYGFISQRLESSRSGTPEPRPPQRVSTILQLVSETPRKTRTFGRSPSIINSSRGTVKRPLSSKAKAKSLHTQASKTSQKSTSRAAIRVATNRLPGNRDKRWMDEAGDMLTLPPGLADIAEDEEGGKTADSLKKQEWDRSEKWRKMARIINLGKDGEGMEFDFDTKSPKLIERTWKGIPDRWRAAAWHSFLKTSAKKRKDSPNDEDIIKAFHKLQMQSSADDVQIDTDVPRTINSHIMFRRRYRGGQRLLFRVLHALSLYFPITGYVQGMASLAATLLCYYDEEKCFVMLVRMWTLRGLDRLYEAGFPGLMAALDEFQKNWLSRNKAVAQKLEQLSIDPTLYGTRWYLTLFNFSIPFPAQLRVWDVFMLLGDPDPISSLKDNEEKSFRGGLDVLHATSAALIDGTREILLDSDFENAMKVLTSWIPVKDEELLMRVARAEWRLRRGKGKR